MRKTKLYSGKILNKVLINLSILFVLFVIIFFTLNTHSNIDSSYKPYVYASSLSLLPPLLAIILAPITKEVFSSLFAGISFAALLYSNGNAELALNTMLYHETGGLISNLTHVGHVGILLFLVFLSTIVVLINKSGGAEAFGKWASKHIKTRTGAQFIAIFMGVMIFIDDAFSCMTVGSVMKPITDKHNISRAKLAYLLDATAAPICIIAPISCWAAAVTYSLPKDMNINGFQVFISTIPYNLYALGTLLMLIILTIFNFDYGPMKLHESNALKGDLFSSDETIYNDKLKDATNKLGRVSDLVIPVVTMIISCTFGIIYTGGIFSGSSIIQAFSNSDAAKGLVFGSFITLIVTFWLYMNRKIITFKDFMDSFSEGFRSMCTPIIVLSLSWTLSSLTNLLGTADYIRSFMQESLASFNMFVPAIVFVVSSVLAFSTGTSWGTFTILIPIVCAIFPVGSQMFVIAISACLSGAVCGDHCSPISDTTIMASAGAGSNHINHVATQLPYALTVAITSTFGYILSGLLGYYYPANYIALISTPITLLVLILVIFIIKKTLTSQIKNKLS